MKKFFLVLALVFSAVSMFAVSWSGAVDVVYSVTASPFDLGYDVGLVSNDFDLKASGDHFYLNLEYDLSAANFSIKQAYCYNDFGPLTMYFGKKYYMAFPFPMTDDSSNWGYWGGTYVYHTYYLGAKADFGMGDVTIMTTPEASPKVSALVNLNIDPVSVTLFAKDNADELSGVVAGDVAGFTLAGAFGWSTTDSTLTTLAVAVSGGFGNLDGVVDLDLTDFSAIGINAQLNYSVNDKLSLSGEVLYAMGTKEFNAYLWADYDLNDDVLFEPKVSIEGGNISLDLLFEYGF